MGGACYNSCSGLLLLFFFYFGLALTLAYSLRLSLILFDTCHLRPLCFSSVSANFLCKAPVIALALRAILQGTCCWSSLSAVPSPVSVMDTILVILVLVVTLL